MNDTPNLALPYILAAQAQKHVTHNEAIRALDCLVQLSVESRTLTAPPASPAEGARYVVAASPTGAWSGNAGRIAAFQDGAWTFYAPKDGWVAWVAAESALVIYAAGAWSLFAGSGGGGEGGGLSAPVANSSLANMANGTIKGRSSSGSGAPEDLTGAQATALLDAFTGSGASHKKGLVPDPGATAGTAKYLREDGSWSDVSNVPLVGVNTTADATNKFAVKSAATLFDNAGNGHQQKINKAAASDTASQLYQTNYSGRAEMGLTGDEDFHFKVSADGATWREAIKIDRNTGFVSFPQSGGPREVLTANRTYYVRSDGSDSNNGLTNTSGGAFATIGRALTVAAALDCSTFNCTVSVGAGTFAQNVVLPRMFGSGTFTLQGAGPTTIIQPASGIPISVSYNGTRWFLTSVKLASTNANLIECRGAGSVVTITTVEFGNAGTAAHVFFALGAIVNTNGNYSISGNAVYHFNSSSVASSTTFGRTITFIGAPRFSSYFAYATSGSVQLWGSVTFNYPTATISIASPGVVTYAGHNLSANQPLAFATTGALPTGLTAGTTYYVKTVIDADTFTVSATAGGTEINTSGSQSGTHSIIPTGTRYLATQASVVDTSGGGASYLPGNAAGSTATGGQYT
ncbi:DUF2793 domain-containing protein [Hyphomicrobium sp. 99]|uniref:DUF2793 domain-containing protein n=1 Tax=Hyphomicrobium sp. 99 TaxID=1163419 RepID=UPI000695C37B|nr:DUF2793 domain-containing protein [Hyphomicrobium sp. 99]